MQTHKNRSCVCCSGIWTWNKPLFFTHFHFCKPMKCKCHTFWVFSVNRVCHSWSWRLPAYLRARLAGQKYPYGFQGLYIHQTQDVSQDWREEGESFWIPEASLHKIFRRHALFKKKKVGLYSKKDVMVLFIFFFLKKESFCTLPFDDRILDAFGISAGRLIWSNCVNFAARKKIMFFQLLFWSK